MPTCTNSGGHLVVPLHERCILSNRRLLLQFNCSWHSNSSTQAVWISFLSWRHLECIFQKYLIVPCFVFGLDPRGGLHCFDGNMLPTFLETMSGAVLKWK